MKKIIALMLALVLALGLVACGAAGSGDKAPAKDPAQEKIEKFVEENKKELLESMEASFATSSGMTCTSSIKVEGKGFVIQININEMEDIDADTKALLQEIYDGMGDVFKGSLEQMQTELPELEYFKVLVCEKDGDVLATIEAK